MLSVILFLGNSSQVYQEDTLTLPAHAGWCLLLQTVSTQTRPRGHKTFFMLNSTEHEISTRKNKNTNKRRSFLLLSLSDVVFMMLLNVKMPTIFDILTFMSWISFLCSRVEHGKSFINSGPGWTKCQAWSGSNF